MSTHLQTNGVSSLRGRSACRVVSSVLLVAVAWLGVPGCTGTIGTNRSLPDVPGPNRGMSTANQIGRVELAPHDDASLEGVLQRLRPEWLRVNPSSRQIAEPARASIYIDDAYMGEPAVLRAVPVAAVMNVWFLRPLEAVGRFGAGCHCAGGVILVQTRVSRADAR